MEVIVRVADDLTMPDKKGACIIAGMTVAQEAGDDETGDRIPEFWCPANPTGDPETMKYEHDSTSNEDRSSGYYQQQPPWWGTAAQRMDLYESTKLFMTSLKRYPYRASNAQEANTWAQKVQGSSFPNAYTKWWQLANDIYNNVKGVPAPPASAPHEGYGLPKGTRITYGSPGFPDWVYRLAAHFNVKASTYPGHQETNRNEAGYAPNPQLLNRGIDWAGSNADMQRLADYLFSIRGELEQLIWENPQTNRRLGVAGGKDVTATGYYAYPGGYDGHRDHVHTRQDHALPLPGGAQPAPAPPKPAIQRHGDPVWLPEVLRAEGLTVVEMPGWRDRGHGDFGEIWGIVAHHTGSNNASPESIAFHPSLGLASQIHLARNGVVTLCGAGIAWHAGNGSWPGLPNNGANARTIGIEAANDGGGSPGKPHRSSWPAEQYDAYVKVCAAILRKLGWGVDHLIAHKEWAGRAQGKWDPGAIDMNIFRADVAARLTNSPAQPSGDDMALVPQDQWDRVFRELTQRHPSRSPLRALGEGDVDTWAGMSLNSDGNIHVLATHLRALLGHPKTLRDLEKLATADPAKWPDRRDDIQLAQSILADVTSAPQPVISAARVQSITDAPDPGALVSAVTAAVHEAAATIPPPVVINQAPEQPAPSTTYTGTPGQVLGQVYDAIAALDLSADLPPETKAALSAVVGILQVKIGASA